MESLGTSQVKSGDELNWKGIRNRNGGAQHLKKGNTEWAERVGRRDMMEVTVDSLCIGFQLLFLLYMLSRGWRGISWMIWHE